MKSNYSNLFGDVEYIKLNTPLKVSAKVMIIRLENYMNLSEIALIKYCFA